MNRASGLCRAAGILALSLSLLAVGMLMPVRSTYADMSVTVGATAAVTNTGGDSIRVRAGAGTGFAQVARTREGETVTVLAGPSKDTRGSSWYRVQTPGGTGWIAAQFLTGKNAPTADQKPAAGPSAKAILVLASYARVANTDGDLLRARSSPNRESTVAMLLARDTAVTVEHGPVSDNEGTLWYQVSAGGTTGWAMAQYLVQAQAPAKPAVSKPAPAASSAAVPHAQEAAPSKAQPAAESLPPPVDAAQQPRSGVSRGTEPPVEGPVEGSVAARGQQIVDTGMQYVGTRYVRGGTGPGGFDCSGFMYYVLNKAGVRVSRDMVSQLNSGPRVSTKDLIPGDLLFWSNTYKPGLSHAGIYIGNGKFVHAENESTGVIITPMSNPYYASRFTAAVRPR